jgi:hypothetical protein
VNKKKPYDPLTYVYPRTLESAFGFSPFAIERPRHHPLVRFWGEIVLAVAIVAVVVLILRGAA